MAQTFHPDPHPNSDRLRDSQRRRDAELGPDADMRFDDPMIARERAEERERAEARAAARDHAADVAYDDDMARAEERPRPDDLADDMARREHHGAGTSYLSGRTTDESLQQWRQIQADFVDNPRSAVADAHGLVGSLINDIVRKFEDERNQLEQRWSSGEDVSTEDLRRCLQTYRDFFNRLLATNTGDAKV